MNPTFVHGHDPLDASRIVRVLSKQLMTQLESVLESLSSDHGG